ncbi:MAG: hypothetical protein KatS3mg111_1882 [Pirellulaceae bacterium]|nr:MAG: hypothetical protein KatS3mg111_1882 [Pirellulaceae bacterium]
MTSDASYYQFPSEVWEVVQNQAWYALQRKELSPDSTALESVRCVYIEEETELEFGRQVWFFEASGVDLGGRHRQMYGALDFTVEYGLMAPQRAIVVQDPHYRQRFLQSVVKPPARQVWNALSTKVWVRLTLASAVILAALWLLSVAVWVMERSG